MSPYIVLGLVATIATLVLLDRVSPRGMASACCIAYLGIYVLVVGGSAAFVVTRIASLGTLTVFSHAWVASLYGLAWSMMWLLCRPLLREVFVNLDLALFKTAGTVQRMRYGGFSNDKPQVLAFRLWELTHKQLFRRYLYNPQ
jgi:hypothetical protein